MKTTTKRITCFYNGALTQFPPYRIFIYPHLWALSPHLSTLIVSDLDKMHQLNQCNVMAQFPPACSQVYRLDDSCCLFTLQGHSGAITAIYIDEVGCLSLSLAPCQRAALLSDSQKAVAVKVNVLRVDPSINNDKRRYAMTKTACC